MVTVKTLLKDERGVVMVISLLILALLVGAGVGAIVSTQTDLKTSGNVKVGAQAFYLASAGIERGKKWLNANIGTGSFPNTIDENFGAGSYNVTIALDDGRYTLTSIACLPAGNPCPSGNSKKEIKVIMDRPDFTPSAAINIDGDGTHPDLDDCGGGAGCKIPSFSIDGRNHSADGSSLSSTCANVSPFAGTESGANTDITDKVDELKSKIVERAKSFCNPITKPSCTDGLSYVKGLDLKDTPGFCPDGDNCYNKLDLSKGELRGATDTTPEVDKRGPFTPSGSLPLVKQLTGSELAQFQQSIADLIEFSNTSPASKKNCISADIKGGTSTFGTPSDPKITYILKDCPSNPTYVAGSTQGADLDIKDGAVVNGAGIMIVPKRLRIRDATFNWQGIVLVVEDGDFRVGVSGSADSENSCGAINGAMILQDDQGNDPKLDMDKVSGDGCTSPNKPFAINFSCDAVNVSLQPLLKQISWVEKF